MEKDFVLISFNSPNVAVKVYASLRQSGISPVLMPTPRCLAASCGLSLRLSEDAAAGAAPVLLSLLRPEQFDVYHAAVQNGRPVYTPKKG